MNDVFTMIGRYGARINFYSDVGINLILIAIAKRNLAQCESIFSFGITKNMIECPNALQVLDPVIAQIFQKGRINEYELFKKYFKSIVVSCDGPPKCIKEYSRKSDVWRSLVKQPLIHNVVEKKDLKFCQILISDGFHVNSRDISGNLPVHVAARVGDSVIMGQLLKSKAKINAKNHANQGPLHLAAKNGHKEVFDILISCDADDFKDISGKTAEDYALENGHYDRLYVDYLPLYS